MLNDFKSFIKVTKKCWSNFTRQQRLKEILLIIAYIAYNGFLFALPADTYDRIVSSHSIASLLLIGISVVLLLAIFGYSGIWNTGVSEGKSREEFECSLFSAWLFFMIIMTSVLLPTIKQDVKFGLILLAIILIFLTIIIELIFLIMRKSRKQYEEIEALTMPETTELTAEEKKLIQKVYTSTKLPMPMILAMFLFSMTAITIIMIIPSETNYPFPPISVACFAILAPIFIYGFLLGKYSWKAKSTVYSPEWATILLKLVNKKTDENVNKATEKSQKLAIGGLGTMILGKYIEGSGLKGADIAGELAGGAMAVYSVSSSMKAIRTHAEEIAELANVKLHKSIVGKILEIIVVPFILFVIANIAIVINSDSLNQKFEKINEKPIDVIEQTMEKDFDGDVSVSVYNKNGGQITTFLNDERKAMLKVNTNKETGEITEINYTIYIGYDESKEEALNRIGQ